MARRAAPGLGELDLAVVHRLAERRLRGHRAAPAPRCRKIAHLRDASGRRGLPPAEILQRGTECFPRLGGSPPRVAEAGRHGVAPSVTERTPELPHDSPLP